MVHSVAAACYRGFSDGVKTIGDDAFRDRRSAMTVRCSEGSYAD